MSFAMFKRILGTLSILFITLSISCYAEPDQIQLDKSIQQKFDQNITKLEANNTRYIVYFGSINQSELASKNTSASSNKKKLISLKDQKAYVSARLSNILEKLSSKHYHIIQSYKAVPTMVIEASPDTIIEIAKSPYVMKIGLDNNGGKGHLIEAIPQTNIDLVKAVPLSGASVEVAIIDSGLDKDHPDFAGRVASQACFSTDCNTSVEDQNGHGTNVTGILASAGAIAPEGGAPEATLHIVKLLSADNSYDSASQAIEALDYIITDLPNVSVINMSFGSNRLFTDACDNDFSWTQSLSDAVNQLNARGVTLFASSGNEGDDMAITAPACLNNVIAVGAVWDAGISRYNDFCNDPSPVQGEITCFSNSNEHVDIVAPGAFTTASGINGGISTYSGTSMASPLVASCATLLKQYNTLITPSEMRSLLIDYAGQEVIDRQGRTFPSLDCWQAFQALPSKEPAEISITSPQDNSQHPSNQTLTFTAHAEDQKDGDISNHIQWFYNEVVVADGKSFSRIFESGMHTVRAQIENSTGHISQASISFSINEPTPPVVTPSPDSNSSGGSFSLSLLLILFLASSWYLFHKKLT
jgi:subtilisin family serine protease